MKLNKFVKKIYAAIDTHSADCGEYPTSVERAAIVLELIDARRDMGKDASDVASLEDAAAALLEAEEVFERVLNDLAEAAEADM